MVLESCFGMLCGDLPLNFFFHNCLLLHVVKIHGWWRICNDKMVTFYGIFCLLDMYMIGMWKWSLIF